MFKSFANRILALVSAVLLLSGGAGIGNVASLTASESSYTVGPKAAFATRGADHGETLYPGIGRASVAAPVANQAIVYNGGPLMGNPINIYVIWYGSWNDPTHANPASGDSIVTDYLSQIGPSNRNFINAAYKFGAAATGTNVVLKQQVYVPSSTYGTALGGSGVTNIVNYAITNSGLPSDANGLYFVFTSAGMTEGTTASGQFLVNYCGYHSYMTRTAAPSTRLKYSFVGDPTGPSFTGCSGNKSTTASPNSNPGVDAMISVIQHELEETMTDPELNAFWDSSSGTNTGNENSDICAWTFGTTTAATGYSYNLSLGSRKYLVQQNWWPGTTTAVSAPASFTGGACRMDSPGAAAIGSFSPASGTSGTTLVTLTGSNFTGATAVKFNGVAATSFSVTSATTITATVPAGATTGTIQVVTPLGAATSSAQITLAAGPASSLTSFSPLFGAEGSTVTITGTGFTGATGVSFNGLAASAFTVVNDTTITATVPVGSTSGAIAVAATGGTLTSTTGFLVTVGAAPTIASFSPTSALAGASVVITGSNFTGATGVTFNGIAVASFTVDSDTQITAVVPSGTVTGVIRVSTPGGWVVSATNFTQIATAITGISPASGNSGTLVTISGSNFTGTTSVKFNGIDATGFTVVNDSSITATAPALGTTGTIAVSGVNGTATSTASFAYPTPTIASFTPTTSSRGSTVVITGTNFTGARSVTFNGVAATSFTVSNATTINAVIPTGATTGRIAVVNGGGTATSATNLTISVPTLTSFTSAISVGSTVNLAGTNLIGVTGVSFNGVAATTFSVVSATSISVVVPAGITAGRVSITSPSGTVTSTGAYTLALPTVTAISPTALPVGTAVAITGTNFTGATAVNFGTVSATTFSVISATSISAVVPAGIAAGSVTVITPTGTSNVVKAFTVATPTITRFTAASGGPGTTVTLTGTNFTTATDVKLNGMRVPGFRVVSATSIIFGVPTGSTTGFIQVVTPTATATSATTFAVTAAVVTPTITGITASGGTGSTVTITGTNLAGATAVTINGAAAPFTMISATQILAAVPAGATGTGKITVTVPAGTATSTGNFAYSGVTTAPLATSLSVTTASAGTTITVTGSNLVGVTSVTINGVSMSNIKVVSATQISFVIPAGATSGILTVTTLGGVVNFATAFTVR